MHGRPIHFGTICLSVYSSLVEAGLRSVEYRDSRPSSLLFHKLTVGSPLQAIVHPGCSCRHVLRSKRLDSYDTLFVILQRCEKNVVCWGESSGYFNTMNCSRGSSTCSIPGPCTQKIYLSANHRKRRLERELGQSRISTRDVYLFQERRIISVGSTPVSFRRSSL